MTTRPRVAVSGSSRTARITATAAAFSLLLVGCSGTDSPPSPTPQAQSVDVSNQWVKSADGGMTAAFGELRNNSDRDIRVVAASSPSAQRMELHEVVADPTGAMAMRQKDGGFVIPAGGTHLLAPGNDHLMLMGVTSPITAGSDARVTLTFEDSSSTTFTATARDFSGAREEYQPGGATAPGHGG